MSIQDINTDKLFRDRLHKIEIAPPPEVWDRVAGSLYSRKNRGVALFMWWSASAAMLLFAFIGAWYLFDSGRDNSLLLTSLVGVNNQNINLDTKLFVSQSLSIELSQPNFDAFHEAILAENRRLHLQSSHIKQQDSITYKKMQLRSELLEYDDELVVDLVGNINSLSSADKAIVESNLLTMNNKSDRQYEARWLLGIKGSPIFNFDVSKGFNDADFSNHSNVDQSNIITSYKPSFAGGMLFAYKANKRLKITSGVQYNEVSQGASGIPVSFAGQNWLNNMIDESYGRYYGSNESNDAAYQNENTIELSTQTGIANVTLPGGIKLNSLSKAESYIVDVVDNYSFKQIAAYVEVPFVLQYRIVDKRFGLYLNGGFNTNFLVNNSVQLTNDNKIVAKGITEDLRTMAFSSSMGMGIDYMLSRHFILNIEPTMKFYLSTLNDKSVFTAKPYTFGVFSGITFQF